MTSSSEVHGIALVIITAIDSSGRKLFSITFSVTIMKSWPNAIIDCKCLERLKSLQPRFVFLYFFSFLVSVYLLSLGS